MEKSPIRVLLVFKKMDRGGAETLVMNIYRKIDRSKVQFDFIVHTDDTGAFDEEIKSLGGKIFHFPQYAVTNHRAYKKVWKEFLSNHSEYSVVHAHMTGPASVFLPIAKKYGCFTIAHSHIAHTLTDLVKLGIKEKLVYLYQIPLRWTADYLFSCSDLAGKWMFGKNVVYKKNYKLLKNGVDLRAFEFNCEYRQEIRNSLGVGDEFVIGNIARFSQQKNHEFLIDIFYEIHNKDEDAVLLLAGDGEERIKIEEKVKQLGIENNVVFAGVRSDVNKILSAMDLFVMPSFNEGLPVSLVEAQASGIPIMASDAISEEVKITECVEFCSLKESSKKWAEKALAYKNKERNLYLNELREAGYDIQETADWLTDFYIEKAGVKKQ